MESLVHVVWIVGAVAFVFSWSRMGFFGGPSQEDLDAINAELGELKKKLARADVRVDEQKKKVVKLQAELEQAAVETKDVRHRATQHRDECRKFQRQLDQVEARTLQAPVEEKAREELLAGLKEEVSALKQRNAGLASDVEEARQQVGALERDKARLEKDAAAAEEEREARRTKGDDPSRDQARRAQEATVEPAGAGRQAAARDEGLRAKLNELKETLRFKDGLLRKLRNQAEHNRRAFVITQLQLDLAQDEAYLLRHGKRRRDTELSRRQVPVAAEPEPSRELVEPEPESATDDPSREPATVDSPEPEEIGAEAPPTSEPEEIGAEAPPTSEPEEIGAEAPPTSEPEETE